MSQEVEQRRFRRGETAKRPYYWGNVANAPFAQALRCVGVDRDYKSQSSLSKTLEAKSNSLIFNWSSNRSIPSPEKFGQMVVLFQPHDEKLELFIEAYAQEIEKGRGAHGPLIGGRLEMSRRETKPSEYQIGKWIEGFCVGRKISLKQFFGILGFSAISRDSLGLTAFDHISQTAPEALGLSEEEMISLVEAIEQTKQKKVEEGHRFYNSQQIGRSNIKKIQVNINYPTYNGSQLAQEFRVSRQTISVRRKKHGLPLLLTEEQKELVGNDLDRTKGSREKQQQSRMMNRPNNLAETSLAISE